MIVRTDIEAPKARPFAMFWSMDGTLTQALMPVTPRMPITTVQQRPTTFLLPIAIGEQPTLLAAILVMSPALCPSAAGTSSSDCAHFRLGERRQYGY